MVDLEFGKKVIWAYWFAVTPSKKLQQKKEKEFEKWANIFRSDNSHYDSYIFAKDIGKE